MTETTEPTLEQDEQTVKEESWQKCEKQLRVVMGLLNSLHDGLIGDGTFTYGGGGENDKHSVQLLYLYRSFNSVRCSYELVQLGYYTQAISLLRSALEDLLVCQRCKKEQVMPEGSTPINIFLAIMKSFNKIHRKCKKVERI